LKRESAPAGPCPGAPARRVNSPAYAQSGRRSSTPGIAYVEAGAKNQSHQNETTFSPIFSCFDFLRGLPTQTTFHTGDEPDGGNGERRPALDFQKVLQEPPTLADM
jgi:hypothetical protein